MDSGAKLWNYRNFTQDSLISSHINEGPALEVLTHLKPPFGLRDYQAKQIDYQFFKSLVL